MHTYCVGQRSPTCRSRSTCRSRRPSLSISKLFIFLNTEKKVSSEMFSNELRKTNIRKDLRLIHERQLFKSEDVRRADMNVITNDCSQIQAFPLNAPSKAACTLPRQTPTFSNKRQQTPAVGSACASSWCLLVIVGYCRKSSTRSEEQTSALQSHLNLV